ncbi:hypothetical protein QBC38DRAFT_460101 [Podospora fimiseda]|uniref:Zn(2)-C6 fungal-type domain-containing protein n=1 Tax=Podospora fimiseda TaxID=252190 RepID=A0AAN6YP54_9PEZI|nr:hypothetical protein QBC38DRAFT_460101 [Podospora fimiseda]
MSDVQVDGKAPKLRASCDNCNESKVRCSQQKPTCRRCARHGVICIYGLSRRSHRMAPRVGELQAPPSVDGSNKGRDDRSRTGSTDPGSSWDAIAVDSTPTAATVVPIDFGATDMDFVGQFDVDDWQFSEATTAFDLSLASFDPAIFDSFKPISSTIKLPPPAFSPTCTAFADGDRPDSLYPPPSTDCSQCDCNHTVVKQLLSLSVACIQTKADQVSMDAQFAQLRQSINVVEDWLNCRCGAHESMAIMTTSVLIGQIIEGFEFLLTNANNNTNSRHHHHNHHHHYHPNRERNNPATTTTTTTTTESVESNTRSSSIDSIFTFTPPNSTAVPRLSWGMLQIEPDEEVELRQYMLRMQLRKLQSVIKKLTPRLAAAGGNNGNSGHSAQIMICQGVRMWLTQKVESLRVSTCNES